MLAQTTGLPVHCYLSGKLGGVQQITSRVACDEVDLVLFFRDPLKADAAGYDRADPRHAGPCRVSVYLCVTLCIEGKKELSQRVVR